MDGTWTRSPRIKSPMLYRIELPWQWKEEMVGKKSDGWQQRQVSLSTMDGTWTRSPRIKSPMLCQIELPRLWKRRRQRKPAGNNARSAGVPWTGLEPATLGLKVRCSTELSYHGYEKEEDKESWLAGNNARSAGVPWTGLEPATLGSRVRCSAKSSYHSYEKEEDKESWLATTPDQQGYRGRDLNPQHSD